MLVHIKFLAHASFLIRADRWRIVTDPYVPDVLGFQTIDDPADIVIRSSDDDLGHCHAEMIQGNPSVITATEVPAEGCQVQGLTIHAIGVKESLIYKDAPLDNAMYHFCLGGVRIAHMGDAGNRLTDDQIGGLAGADILLALAGGPPTIDMQDLYDAIAAIQPRVVIPMHYGVPGCKVEMLPVTDLTKRFPASDVDFTGQSEIAFTSETLPRKTRIVVLEPSTAGICQTS